MTALDTSIRVLYENDNLTSGEIAEALGVEELLVKDVLSRISPVFRAQLRAEPEGEEKLITKDELAILKESHMDLARYAPDDHIRERAGRFLILNYQGFYKRKDPNPADGKVSVGALTINQYIIAAKEKAQKALAQAKEEFIDV